jgi:hypothetical protein
MNAFSFSGVYTISACIRPDTTKMQADAARIKMRKRFIVMELNGYIKLMQNIYSFHKPTEK